MKRTSRSIHRIALGALAIFLLAAPASANRLIPFQGRVTDGAGQPLEGVFRVTFTIYDEPTGGNDLFAETHENVSVIGGQINVLLGSLVSLDDPNGDQNPADAVQFNEALKPRFLGIKIGAAGNQEMVPRHQLVPSFHARIADIAGTTADGGVGTDQIADGSVTFQKLSADALEAIIPPGSIMPYGGTTAPPGWVLCDGSPYDRSDPQFAKLFDAIGESFGGTEPLFNVPDLRGQFLRGLDPSGTVDPDGASRTLGSAQGTAIVGLSGQVVPTTVFTSVDGQHDHRIPNSNFNNQGTVNDFAFDLNIRSNSNVQFSFSSGAHQHSVGIPASPVNISPTSGATSTETRPKNVAVNYIIKL
jgi:microcystin-dependent protein